MIVHRQGIGECHHQSSRQMPGHRRPEPSFSGLIRRENPQPLGLGNLAVRDRSAIPVAQCLGRALAVYRIGKVVGASCWRVGGVLLAPCIVFTRVIPPRAPPFVSAL